MGASLSDKYIGNFFKWEMNKEKIPGEKGL